MQTGAQTIAEWWLVNAPRVYDLLGMAAALLPVFMAGMFAEGLRERWHIRRRVRRYADGAVTKLQEQLRYQREAIKRLTHQRDDLLAQLRKQKIIAYQQVDWANATEAVMSHDEALP